MVTHMNMKIIKTGELEENCYIITSDKTIIIDPGSDADKIIDVILKDNLNLDSILITHHHFDHIGALKDILKYKNVKVYEYLDEGNYNISGFNIEVIKTDGHTSDSLTYYFKDYNMMIVGDFIFKGSVGRWDLDTGSYDALMKSIDKIKTYDKDIVIYPGHGDATTLGEEINSNMFF